MPDYRNNNQGGRPSYRPRRRHEFNIPRIRRDAIITIQRAMRRVMGRRAAAAVMNAADVNFYRQEDHWDGFHNQYHHNDGYDYGQRQPVAEDDRQWGDRWRPWSNDPYTYDSDSDYD